MLHPGQDIAVFVTHPSFLIYVKKKSENSEGLSSFYQRIDDFNQRTCLAGMEPCFLLLCSQVSFTFLCIMHERVESYVRYFSARPFTITYNQKKHIVIFYLLFNVAWIFYSTKKTTIVFKAIVSFFKLTVVMATTQTELKF